jgi:endogenous inhibitor of DNA gyrase (YacG/DUF329 family)
MSPRQGKSCTEKKMVRYWTSKKQKSVVSERRKQLDLLFEFANAELREKKNDQLKRQIYDLLNSIMTGHSETCPDLMSAGSDGLIKGLQKHIRARLKKMIHNTKLLVEMPLWKMGGSIEFTVDAKTNRFYERFRFRKIKPGNELKALKRMIDRAIIDIIRDLDFKPNRFRQCPKCGKFFYQPTEKEKSFCSIRCGDAVRLQQFRKETRKVQGGKPESFV